MKLLRLIGLIFAMVGLIMFIVLGFVYSNERRFVASSRAAEGTVIDLVLDVSTTRRNGAIRRTNHVYKPLVAFRTASGQETAFLSSSGSNPPSYSVGDRREGALPSRLSRARQAGGVLEPVVR